MNISLVEIEPEDRCEDPEIQQRHSENNKTKLTTCYRALCNGREVAFVSLDRWPKPKPFVIYEMYVPHSLRRQGLGTAILNHVEEIAQQEGYSIVRLSPRPLDFQNIEPDALVAWLGRQGYQKEPQGTGEMEKRIVKEPKNKAYANDDKPPA